MIQFPLRIDPIWRIPLLVIGVTPKRAVVTLDDDSLHIRFGLYQARVLLADIADVKAVKWSWFYGVGLRASPDAIGYITSLKGVVRVGLRQALPFTVLFKLQMDFDGVALSLRDPEGFIRAVEERLKP